MRRFFDLSFTWHPIRHFLNDIHVRAKYLQDHFFDTIFDAYLGNDTVHEFSRRDNPNMDVLESLIVTHEGEIVRD